jgi:hypothetical protein
MVILEIHIGKSYQSFVILNFFIPYLENSDAFIEYFNRKNDYLFFLLKNTAFDKKFGSNLKREWFLFISQNKNIIIPNNQEKADNLFLEYPLGHLKILDERLESNDLDKEAFNLTKTNLKVLSLLQEEEKYDENLIGVYLTFIYSIGGYSPKKIQKLSKYFLTFIHFDKKVRDLLDKQKNTIQIESHEFLTNHIKAIYSELTAFYTQKQYPSFISEYKYSYKGFCKNSENLISDKHLDSKFEQLRNQLGISDSESYIILSLIDTYFKNSL